MAELRVRWSEHEARKPYARPLMVSFDGDDGAAIGSIAVSGADLLYWRQFQVAVAGLAGELFVAPAVGEATDPQLAWLAALAALLPEARVVRVVPSSSFDHDAGRVFGFTVELEAGAAIHLGAPALLEYQEMQASIAHQAGRLFRVAEVEFHAEPGARHVAWLGWLRDNLDRPGPDEALAGSWPWR